MIFLLTVKLDRNLFFSHPNSNEGIDTKCHTCHSSYAVVACAKFAAIWSAETELQQKEYSIEFGFWVKKSVCEMDQVIDSMSHQVVSSKIIS